MFGIELVEHDHGGAIVARRRVRFQLRRGRPHRKPAVPEPEAQPETPQFQVRILDNPWNTYEEVIHICQLALQCTLEEAYAIAWEVDHAGSAVVLEGDQPTAEMTAQVIGSIGIEVRVEPMEGSVL